MTLQYLSKAFINRNAFCDCDLKARPQVTDDTVTFAGDPLADDCFILSLKWTHSENGFQFTLLETQNCILFGTKAGSRAPGALTIGDTVNWEPNNFDGDRIRFTLKLV